MKLVDKTRQTYIISSIIIFIVSSLVIYFTLKNVFAKKGEDMVKLNLRALRAGRDYAKKST